METKNNSESESNKQQNNFTNSKGDANANNSDKKINTNNKGTGLSAEAGSAQTDESWLDEGGSETAKADKNKTKDETSEDDGPY